jgi:hypothetical protein
VRPPAAFRYLLALLALGVFWRLQPEVLTPFLSGGIAFNLGSSDQPRVLHAPTVAILIVPLALRFGLPLILKAALLLPFAATAAMHRSARGLTFDPARDLPNDSSASSSTEDAAIDKAIAAALAARNAASTARPAFAKADRAPDAIAPSATPPVGRRDAAA